MNFEFMLIIPILTYTVKSFDIPCWSSSFTIFDCCKVQTDTYSQELLLHNKLKNDVFGQHIAQGKIGKMIFSHAKNKYPRKALVMSFHGWTGNGKNFVAKQIVDALYVEGMKNRNVHIFFSTLHFPKEDQVDIYKIHLIDWIRGNVSRCDRSMFIFDEVDKMPPGLLDAIKPFMDYHVEIDGVDYRKSIFLLLSNTGGHDITQKSLELWKKGRKREEFKYEDFEKLIQMGAFNEPGSRKIFKCLANSIENDSNWFIFVRG
ncbi:hypothetical protein QYM36_009891 [Artemia franciscana]|uniref:Uncharacterized protein n=1 Tax=Artemia franciscana TaxID=6661 RepID=A0AA88HTY3_ARTSF|nr:hypothetical protein QYM36_009891 [Artemia franciscana]